MKHLKERIERLIESNQITDEEEKERLTYLIKVKKWNPYCIRHSAITADSDYLPEYALKKKVRWSMNSKQGSRYIKRRMGNELKNKILEYNGIITEETQKKKPLQSICPRCDLSNVLENKYCSKCSYPLKPEAFDEIKEEENQKIMELEARYKEMDSVLQNLVKAFSSVDEQGKQIIARQLIQFSSWMKPSVARARRFKWDVQTVEAGHDVMITHPNKLAEILLQIANRLHVFRNENSA